MRLLAVSLLAAAAAGGLAAAAPAGDDEPDRTPPEVAARVSGGPLRNGWFLGNVTVRWVVRDPESGIAASAGCGNTQIRRETRGIRLACVARNRDGLQTARSLLVRIDTTPPTVSAAPERSPDANGWYNRPVRVLFSGQDGISGIVSCDAPEYRGPDGGQVVVSGRCTDAAGHAAGTSVSINYDTTPTGPVRDLRLIPGDRAVTLTWQPPGEADFDRVAVVRTSPDGTQRTLYEGRERGYAERGLANGRTYTYAVVAVDRAGNRAAAVSGSAQPRMLLLVSPRDGAVVRRPPLLRWAPYRSPRYYNVQLWRGGGKVLSLWPARARLQLARTWSFKGRRYTLGRGRYRWYVFPGYGDRRAARDGAMLGSSTFVVR